MALSHRISAQLERANQAGGFDHTTCELLLSYDKSISWWTALYILRFHNQQGKREIRTSIQFRCPRWYPYVIGCNPRKGRGKSPLIPLVIQGWQVVARWESGREDMVQSIQTRKVSVYTVRGDFWWQIFPASRWEIYDPDADYGSYVRISPTNWLTYRKLHRVDASLSGLRELKLQ